MAFIVTFETVGKALSARVKPVQGKLSNTLRLGLVLDRCYVGELEAKPERRRSELILSLTLPGNRLAETLDLVDVTTGQSILPAPYPLDAVYDLRPGPISAADGCLQGSFSVRALNESVLVDVTGGGRTIARGLATRPSAQDETGYRFRIPLLSTIKPNEPLEATVHVAGRALALPIKIAAAAARYVGFVDRSDPGVVSGWAMMLLRPEQRLSVDLVMDGAVVDTVVAERPRDDLRLAGLGDGHSAFEFRLKPQESVQVPRPASVFISGTRMELQGSPVMAQSVPPFRGFFDRLHGMSAHGWAINDLDPKTPVKVEAICNGRVLASAEAKLFRGDLLEADLNNGFCAFKIDIGRQLLDHLDQDVFVRIAGQDNVLKGSPRTASQNPNLLRYLAINRGVSLATLPRLKRRLNHRVGRRSLSIIMPVFNPPKEWLIEALTSVLAQWCDHWELICVDDCSTAPHVGEILRAFSAHDRRVRVLRSAQNIGIARSTNIGLRAASAEYVTFMDHDDFLEPDAVYHLLRTVEQTAAGLIYSDEATTDENINSIAEVKARPAFSYDFYLSHPYFVHMICVRRDLAYQVGGWNEKMAISADVDFVLRLLETDPAVAHVPRVLYRWRTHDSSTGHSKKDAVMAATRASLQQHLDRKGTGAVVEDGVWFNQFRIHWPAADGRVLIVIPTKNKADLLRVAVESIERTAGDAAYRIVVVDHQSDQPASQKYLQSLAERHTVMPYEGVFNYSRMNNLAVKQHGGDCEFVLFLNNDVEAIAEGWLDRMRRLAHRPEVGAVGALLLYPDKRIQHAGVIIGFNGSAEATFKFEHAYLNEDGQRNLGYNCSITSVRDYSAVTAACLMMRTKVFLGLGGFDEVLKIGFNDVDLCLRVRRAGLKVLYDGDTILFHYESATRSQTKEVQHPEDTTRLLTNHREIFTQGDPFYNPNLSYVTQDHVLREDRGCKSIQPRITSPANVFSEVTTHIAPPPQKPISVKRKARLVKVEA